MELKVKTNEAPQLSEARMLLTWLREYYPNLELPVEEPEPTSEEQVDSGAMPGHQLGIPYDEATGEIIVRCSDCQKPMSIADDDEGTFICHNPECAVAAND